MCSKEQLQSVIDDVRAGVCNALGDRLHSLILYGSYARGDYDEESDVDFAVLANIKDTELVKYRKPIYEIASRASLKNDVEVSISLMDVPTVMKLLDAVPYYQNVMREGIRIYEQ